MNRRTFFKTNTAGLFALLIGTENLSSMTDDLGSRDDSQLAFAPIGPGNHYHIVTLLKKDLESLPERGLTILSTSKYDHEHMIELSREHLTHLLKAGSIHVKSEAAGGHRHLYKFIRWF
jgi:hypothetical protein